MAGTKKFGTFAGVYTPSVLTILGVIMYMRLGWVIGQAGLIAAIAIILIAHIISITTSLSISSIATDKKIKLLRRYAPTMVGAKPKVVRGKIVIVVIQAMQS